jgi:hypothetical protein
LKLMRMAVALLVAGILMMAVGECAGQDERRARDIIDAYRVWRLTDVLDLSEDEMPVFFSRIRNIGEAEAEHRKAERDAVKQIETLIDSGAGEAELREALDEYEEMRQAHWNDIQKLREDAASMLTLEQRCKYAVFEEEFRSEIRKMIEDVRGSRGIETPDRGGMPRSGAGKGSGSGKR